MGRKFTIFALVYFVFESKFHVQAPLGAYIRRGDLTEGLRGLYLDGLIYGGAYFRNFTVISSSSTKYSWKTGQCKNLMHYWNKYANMMVLREHPNPRCESTPVSTVLGKLVRFLITKCILIIIRLSKLKSSQYPVQMIQKPRKGDPKTFSRGSMPQIPLEACIFGADLGNRSVSILDLHLNPTSQQTLHTLPQTNVEFSFLF